MQTPFAVHFQVSVDILQQEAVVEMAAHIEDFHLRELLKFASNLVVCPQPVHLARR